MGIRFKIFMTVAAILFSAMLLMCMVMIYMSQHFLIQFETEKGRIFGGMFIDNIINNGMLLADSPSNGFIDQIDALFQKGKLLSFSIIDNQNSKKYQFGKDAELIKKTTAMAYRFIKNGKEEIAYFDPTWNLFVKYPNGYIISFPIEKEKKIIGSAAFGFPLTEAFRRIRTIQEFLLLYLFVNTFLFTLIGGARISRFVLRPIRKLIQRATEYRDGDELLLPYEGGGSEWDSLLRAVNRIVALNIRDNQKLSETVQSLQQAVDELKKAQKEIIRTEKLATVGRLSSGIAHEIGNPIGIILGYLELMQQITLSEKEKSDLILRTIAEVRRIDQIIRQLLDFSKPDNNLISISSVHEVLEEIIEMFYIQPLFSEIEVKPSLVATEDGVMADQSQLHQAFLNFILNAADAIKGENSQQRGIIKICTENIPEKENTCFKKPAIKISFIDNGEGIAPENTEKIFDPFFTTKAPGKGTGLGLWVSIMIIEGFGGKILVDSKIGEGTTMSIILPTAHMKAEESFKWKR